jgi:hypothetical protein
MGTLRIADEAKMFAPALMIKLSEPSSQLYEMKALSDTELTRANDNFVERGLPFRVCRHGDSVLNRVAA